MSAFPDARAAKEFLVAQITAEAERQGTPLSELERKMLYFSETHWSLPDIMEVNEAFEREYDTPAYEQKIGSIVQSLRTRLRKEDPSQFQLWNDAVKLLRSEDHYLIILIDTEPADSGPLLSIPKLIGLGIALALAVPLIMRIYNSIFR